MNVGAILTLLKLLEGAGLTKRAPQDPTSKAGVRPDCGLGEKAYLDPVTDTWRCIKQFD